MVGYMISSIILQNCTSFEAMLGYDVGIWRYPLLVEVVLLFPMCIVFFSLESMKLQINLSRPQKTKIIQCPIITADIESTVSLTSLVDVNIDNLSDVDIDHGLNDLKPIENSLSDVKKILIHLFHLPQYKYIVATMTCLYFVVTGVQYWGPSYMLVAIDSSVSMVNVSFILCVGSSSICGIMFGGWIVDHLGGFKNEIDRVRVLKVCTCFGFISVVGAIAILFTSGLWEFVTLLWIVLYFGASVLPSCSGIIISIVPDQYKTVACGANLMIFNLFGYFLSSTLSGSFMQLLLQFKSNCDYICSRYSGFQLIMLWSVFSLIFLALSLKSSLSFFSVSRPISDIRCW